MAIDFSQDIKTAERQMNTYIRKGQKVPRDVLDHYTKLLSGTLNSQAIENGAGSTEGSSTGSSSPTSYEGDLQYNSVVVDPLGNPLLSGDAARSYILIQNIGSETVYLSINSSNPQVEEGITISSGGSWSSDISQFITSQIWAIVANNSSKVIVYSITPTQS